MVLITELMTSGTLKAFIQSRFSDSKPSIQVIKRWSRQILLGLYYLHSRQPPVIHRDLKCENIFIVGATGEVKIADLGLATMRESALKHKSIIGTPEFMAPEMYAEVYDHMIDVYAFGMCLLEMAVNEYPYNECKTALGVYNTVVRDKKDPECLKNVDNEQLLLIIKDCISHDPKERKTTGELLQNEFFKDQTGLSIEVVAKSGNVLTLRLHWDDDAKSYSKKLAPYAKGK